MASANATGRTGALRDARRAAGLSQEAVARSAGCSTSYVRLLEGGFTPEGGSILPRILAVLDGARDDSPTKSNGAPAKGAAAKTAEVTGHAQRID